MLRHSHKQSVLASLLKSRLFLAAVLIILVIFVFAVVGMYQKSRETEANRGYAKERLNDLNERKMRLESDIERIKSPLGQEEAIREKFRVAKEGEGLIVIVEEPPVEPEEEGNGFVEFFRSLFRKEKR